MIIGYLDNNLRNIGANEQRDIINGYAQSIATSVDVFLCESDIKNIINNLNSKENTVIVANIACLGNKLSQIVENIETLTANDFVLVSVKEEFNFNNSKQTQDLLQGIKLSIDIRNSMVSIITCKALNSKKSKGQTLGRQKGSKNKVHLCDGKYDEIQAYIAKGMPKADIAKIIGTSIATLYNFLREHPELKI